MIVEKTGPFATVQDLGRPGHAALGVGRSGAADRGSLRLANRLVGNPEGNAALEVTLGGLALRASTPCVVAVTGATCAVTAGGRDAGQNAPIFLRGNETLELGTAVDGLRCYVAVRGGFDVEPVLGSRSTDTMGKLGPPALAAGTELPVGRRVDGPVHVDLAPRRSLPRELVLRVTAGPRLDWFTEDAFTQLCTARYTASADVNRIGVRLDGPTLTRARDGELPPEACVPGALQVPPAGTPIVFLADHPVTGGYPVVAVVDEDDLDLAAQARPGTPIRFTPCRGTRPSAARR
jgi:biotin-dependent carboxylase-like uncharacterized protein